MTIKRIILFFIVYFTSNLSFCQSLTDSYYSSWKGIIERNFTTKNKDTLKLIIAEWEKSNSYYIKDSLHSQEVFIKETYILFPKLVEVFYNNFWSNFSKEFQPDEIYYYLPTNITIQFSNKVLPKDMLSYQSEFSGIHKDSLKKHPNAMINEITDSRFYDDFIKYDPNDHLVELNNFKPYLLDSSFRIIYDVQNNYFQNSIEKELSQNSIENSLLNEGLSKSEIRESYPFSGSKITMEYAKRYDHLSSHRVNVSNSIKKVIFYKNYQSAIIEINSNSQRCCPTYYLIFERNNGGWEFNRLFSLDAGSLRCMDFTGQCNFR
ncbi:MAG: hypothetical protein Q8M29_05390 [Bacteroidota bacterium]|nr:hypothetical protein [Bacteroidota bacterium]